MVLDRVAQQIVLDNVRQQLRLTNKGLASELRSYGDLPLATFLSESGRDLVDVYRSNGSWTSLRRAAGLTTAGPGPNEDSLLRRIVSLSHVDDPERAQVYANLDRRCPSLRRSWTAGAAPGQDALLHAVAGPRWIRLVRGRSSALAHASGCLREVRELLAFSADQARHTPMPLGEGLMDVPVFSHARYRREEILAALDWASSTRAARGHATGVVWGRLPKPTDCS